ncbi:alpha/beta hydrolase family protein [Citrobacter telavivensis]
MKKSKFTFTNAKNEELCALLEEPEGEISAWCLFAHCFTCGKDLRSATRISRKLVENGIAVLRFDFTGLGSSEGDFSNTNFSSNLSDLISAVSVLREKYHAPALLVGHSLGGTAILSIAEKVPEAKAVVTIGSPGELTHLIRLFGDNVKDIEENGTYPVNLAGRIFTIKKQMIDDLYNYRVTDRVFSMEKPVLILHSPTDDTVHIEQAEKIFAAAHHPKSFISLANADHLLSKPEDADYVGDCIAAWCKWYI